MLTKSALIMGGNGTLGKAMVTAFKSNSYKVLSVDIKGQENKHADSNLLIDPTQNIQSQLPHLYEEAMSFSKEFDSIICVAGGFDVSHIKDEDILEKYAQMDKINFQSALLTGHLSTKFLAP